MSKEKKNHSANIDQKNRIPFHFPNGISIESARRPVPSPSNA
jgi:hypothetical protein